MTRREMILSLVMGTAACTAFPGLSWGAKTGKTSIKKHVEAARERLIEPGVPLEKAKGLYTGCLNLIRRDTKEILQISYLNPKGEMDPLAWRKLNQFFRCPGTGKAPPISPSLFLLLDGVHRRLEAGQRPLILFSGYRSPAYNRKIARRDRHVARNSYHMKGMAADVALRGIRMTEVRDAARDFCGGGVGCYDDFVHLDVGPVRCW
jgi:uncharacterized protein YcbK (DUF882 family)